MLNRVLPRIRALRITRAWWAISVVTLTVTCGAWFVFDSSLAASNTRGTSQRETELRAALAQIPPPDGAVYIRTNLIDLLGTFQVQDVYGKPPSHPDLKPHYDAILRTQGWVFVGTQIGDEGGRELTTWRKGAYQFTLEYPLDPVNFDYPFEVLLDSR
jgi:hypothetical protein